MHPSLAATRPSSTMPRPSRSGARVTSLAPRQIRSQRICLARGGYVWIFVYTLLVVSDTVQHRLGEGYMPTLWFRTALLPTGWENDVRIDIADRVIRAVHPGSAPEGADE